MQAGERQADAVGEDLVIATAGHIDHGKTALMRALTGVDTDRLPEEKARGISIDIGFAYLKLPPPAQGTLAFVDVPGHERFLRNMLAGVGDAAAALLVVAADDGPMPQTREHLEILDLLGIPGVAVAITKCDRVDAARLAAVRQEVAALVAATSLADAPLIETSAVTGAGIAALRDACLAAAARHAGARDARAGLAFRFAVDRAFTVAGSGTVVTGTIREGRVAPGDALVLAPAGVPVRVRGLQQDGAARASAQAGQRCALNLAGLERSQVERGDWLVAPGFAAAATRLDVALRVAALGEAAKLRHWAACLVHLGPAAVPARLRLRRGAALAAGATGLAQLLLERPLPVRHGDRFVLRDGTGKRTLAGGHVLDPFAPDRGRPGREAELAALRPEDPATALAGLLALRPEGLDPGPFALARGLDQPALAALLARCDAALLGRAHVIAAPGRARLEAAIAAALGTASSLGIPAQALRRQVAPGLPANAFAALLRGLAERGALDLSAGGLVRRPQQAEQARLARDDHRRALLAELDAQGREGMPEAALATRLRAPPAFTRALLEALRREGAAHAIAGRWYGAAAVRDFAETAAQLAAAGGFTAAQFRDAAGIGRNRTIEVLEYLDSLDITRREGASRSLARRTAPFPAGAA